jgi:hypothetical protein
MKIYNIFWNSKNKEATTKKEEEDELVQGERKTFGPPYFQISYLLHFFFVLNNLKTYESAT